jgi:hypothetical protein
MNVLPYFIFVGLVLAAVLAWILERDTGERLSDRLVRLVVRGVLLGCYLVCAGVLGYLLMAVFHGAEWICLMAAMLIAAPVLLLGPFLEVP